MLYIIEFLTLTIKNYIEKFTSCFEITKLLVRIISTPFHINFPIVVLIILLTREFNYFDSLLFSVRERPFQYCNDK